MSTKIHKGTPLHKFIGLYRKMPDQVSVSLMSNPLLLSKVMGAFRGAEGEGGYQMQQDAIQVVPGTATTVDGQPLAEIWTDLNQRLAAFNTQMQGMVSLLTFPTIRAQEQIGVYQTPRFEEATELGRPQKVRLQRVKRGFPLNHRDLGFGYTQEYIDTARSDQITSIASQVENAWWSLNLETVLLAIFTEDNVTDEDGVVVKRFYNGDGEIPPHYKRTTHAGSHTHYLASAGATVAEADINSLEEHLLHHGFGDFGENFILMVNRVDLPDIRALTGYVPANTSTRPVIVDGQVVGQTSTAPPGLENQVDGYIGRFAVVNEDEIPPGYLFGFATGGQFASQNAVGLRSHENPSARGLRLIEGPVARYPLIDAVYDGYLGAGVSQRGAGVVMFITGGGTYVDPTF